MALLKIGRLRAGVTVLFCQQFIIVATFFVLPLYLQTVMGFDALTTGLTILPLSAALFVCALGGSALTGRFSPKLIVEVGLGSMLVGEVLLLAFTDTKLSGVGFGLALALVGAGLGLLASQLSNVIMSSVSSERGAEVGGLQGTIQNLGASLGTALIGSILIAALATTFQGSVASDSSIPDPVKQQISAIAKKSADFVSKRQVSEGATKAGLPAAQVDAIVNNYVSSQIDALKAAFAGIALFALFALMYVRHLPTSAETDEELGVAASET